jgi:uncharacterized membrane protein YsdA (DUF1294 family)
VIKEFFSDISGVQLFATTALLVFFTLFALIILWVIRMDKRSAEHCRRLPLEPDQTH